MTVGKNLGNRTTTELAAGRSEDGADGPSTLIVPLGATEQHGPHLPFNTDTVIASAWADAVAARLGDVVVAPPLPYGSSGEHQAFAGTLSIGQDALRAVLIELVRSAGHSFSRVVLLSGHAGNVVPVREAADQLRREGHDVIELFPTWGSLVDDNDRPIPVDAHAGLTETSLMLHLQPQAVRLDLAVAGPTAPISELLESMVAGGVSAVSSSGVLGDPDGATGEIGARLLEDLVIRTVERLQTTVG
ncbi:MAG: mycofactocin biosynthesis peptidyl-dipeptidase MftE [Actinomycetota bacterium]